MSCILRLVWFQNLYIMNAKYKIKLKGKILKIVPRSVYQESVYTQDIFVELENCAKLRIYDVSILCDQDYLNKIKRTLLALYRYLAMELK